MNSWQSMRQNKDFRWPGCSPAAAHKTSAAVTVDRSLQSRARPGRVVQIIRICSRPAGKNLNAAFACASALQYQLTSFVPALSVLDFNFVFDLAHIVPLGFGFGSA